MNERIKLPAQEWLGYDPEKGDMHGYTFEQMREFAELIVRECAQVARHHALCRSGVAADFAGTVEIQQSILKHFGVDE